MDVVNREHPLAGQFVEVEFKRSGVCDQFVFGLFEGDKNAWLRIHSGAIDQKFDAEHGLAASWTASDKRRTSARESAEGYFVETRDAGKRLFQTLGRLGRQRTGRFRSHKFFVLCFGAKNWAHESITRIDVHEI
jgi:hypothetical protein